MFGDDLKKSLEPIQASDELLAKTRLAIEKARLEQAAQTMRAKKKSRSLSMIWKIGVPVACTALLVGGAVLLLPKLNHKDATKEVTFSVHGKKEDVSDIDLYEDSNFTAATDNREESVYETTVPEAETTISHSKQAGFDKAEESFSPMAVDVDGMWTNATEQHFDLTRIYFGKYVLCIAEDGKSLELHDAKTDALISEDENLETPQIRNLPEDRFIYALVYEEENGSLMITTADSIHPLDVTILDFYMCTCTYENGRLICDEPNYITSSGI